MQRNGISVDLTAREYAVLELLVRSRGRIVTRARLCEYLYNEDVDIASNVVDVYIAYLRNKIDKGADKKLIHTRHGQGYVLSADE